MLISCPLCRTRFRFDKHKVGSTGVRLRCSKCMAVFCVAADSDSRAGRLKVLIAHESKEFCAAVQKVLAREPFTLIVCHDGNEALQLIENILPDVVLLNVALPTMYGFQVCEAIRNNPAISGIKVILLAAIYDKTKYKRSPQSLYGADGYIEQHHIPDALAAMIYRLASDTRAADADHDTGLEGENELETSPDRLTPAEAAEQEIFRKELREQQIKKLTPETDKTAQSAKLLARSIISDISLYREAEVDEGVRNGNFDEILAVEIRDGRSLYEKRVPKSLENAADYFQEALAEFKELKKRELSIS
jgi:predicted Zn finger-like uncharacterized protein